jgi:LysR family transcriptional regulator, regulator of the ytmI operon
MDRYHSVQANRGGRPVLGTVEFRHLQTFRVAVERRAFAKAAEALDYAQSTVTLHIQQLERELGVALFERAGKRVQLTEAGQQVYEASVRVLEAWRDLAEAARPYAAGLKGTVRVGAIEPAASVRLPAILQRFARAHAEVRLAVTVSGTTTLTRALVNRTIDLAICTKPDRAYELEYTPAFEEELVLLVPAGHRLAGRGSAAARDLERERLLLTDPSCAYRRAAERSVLRQVQPRPEPIEIDSVIALASAVRAGLGLALVPRLGATPAPDGTAVLPIADHPPRLTVGIAHRRFGTRTPAAVFAFRDALVRALALETNAA